MSLAFLGQRGPRLTLTNGVSGEQLVANAHPPAFAWSTTVSWPRHEVPGRASVPLQYGLTQNGQVATLELRFDRRLPESEGGTKNLVAVQRFFQKLTAPTPPRNAPPTLLFVWPNLLTFEAVVASINYEHRELALDQQPLLLVVTLSLEGASARNRSPGSRP
jgi:hypothetical protein